MNQSDLLKNKPQPKKPQTRRIFHCPDELWTRLEEVAQASGDSASSLVRRAIREFLRREK